MKHASLFSGIGGFDLAAEWMGWENIFHCEINTFCQRALKYYWPKSISYEDIKTTDFTIHRGTIDVLTGGFPCQGFSLAGLRKGTNDDRYLWPEYLRAIREIKPPFVVGENVTGILSMGEYEVFARVDSRNIVRYADFDHYEAVYTRQEKLLVTSICKDLEKEGYKVQVFAIPAAGVGAPHKRERIWFVAYNPDARAEGVQFGKNGVYEPETITNTTGELRQGNETGKCRDKRRKDVQQENWTTNPKQPGTMGKNGITANPASDRRERKGQGVEIEKGLQSGPEPTGKLAGRFERLCSDESFTNPGDKGLQRNKFNRSLNEGKEGQQTFRPTSELHKSTNWEQFPTQSPVRSGNDGLSSRLVGITVSKHRNESIKGYGNAVVPQVVLQIFKAINEYEHRITRTGQTL